MTRTVLVFLGLVVFAACSGEVNDPAGQTLVGSPCTPSDEGRPEFGGFSLSEVTLDHNHPTCGGGVCLVNHYQGRTTCPNGQSPNDGACTADGAPVTTSVCGECNLRRAHEAVHCSCRCAPPPGQEREPGQNYCACGDGFVCAQLVPIGEDAGAYCIREEAAYGGPFDCGDVDGFWGPVCDGTPL